MDSASLNLQAEVINLIANLKNYIKIPVGVSNKHVHLTEHDYNILFPGEPMNMKKKLNQGDDFASDKLVTLVGPKGTMERVRILGPVRKYSQIELSMTDARALDGSVPQADMTIPTSIKILESEALVGIDAEVISLPGNLQSIANDAFSDGTILIVPSGSSTETQVKKTNYWYVAE